MYHDQVSVLQPSVASTSTGSTAETTVIARAPHADALAVGYSDGSVRSHGNGLILLSQHEGPSPPLLLI